MTVKAIKEFVLIGAGNKESAKETEERKSDVHESESLNQEVKDEIEINIHTETKEKEGEIDEEKECPQVDQEEKEIDVYIDLKLSVNESKEQEDDA